MKITYVVQSGDTLQNLARRYLGDARRWKEFTYVGDPENLKPGDSIHLVHGMPARQPALWDRKRTGGA